MGLSFVVVCAVYIDVQSPYVFGEPNTAAKVLKYITYVGGTLSALALLATAVYPIFVK